MGIKSSRHTASRDCSAEQHCKEDRHEVSAEEDRKLESEFQQETAFRKLKRQASLCDFEGCWNRYLYLAQQCSHPGTKWEGNEDDVDYCCINITEAQARQIEKNRLAILQNKNSK